MKRIFPILATLLSALNVSATIHRVNSGGIAADFTSLQAAHDAALAGDTVHLEPSSASYGPCVLTKRLVIFGPGYFLGLNPQTQADLETAKVDEITFMAGSEGSLISGVEMLYQTNVFASFVRVEHCGFSGQFRIGTVNGLVLSGVVVNGCYSDEQAVTIGAGTAIVDGVVLSNNRVVAITSGGGTISGEATNNVVSWSSNGLQNISNMTLSNNIFDCPVTLGTNNIFTNNLFKFAEVPASNGNQINVDMSAVFIGGIGDAQWQLAPGSPAIGAGTAGIDCGMFAGTDPYTPSGLPPIPTLFGISAPSNTDPVTPLQVAISARSDSADITSMEWFVDIDPGIGAAQPIAIGTPASVLLDRMFQVDAALLSEGPHHVLVRCFNDSGVSSITYPIPFEVLVGIDELSAHGITAGPNPMHETLTLDQTGNSSRELILFDAAGRTVYTGQWTGPRYVIDTSTLSPGSYQLLLRDENGASMTVKLIRQ